MALRDKSLTQQIMVKGQLDLLLASMTQRTYVEVTSCVSRITFVGICNMIEAEDGSGHRFNLHIQNTERHVVYVDLANGMQVKPSLVKSWVEIG